MAPAAVVAVVVVLATGCLHNGSWTTTALAATTPPAAAGSGYELVDISCVSTTWCMAVGRADGPIAQIWNGTTWSNLAVPADAIESVECGAPDRCAAIVDRYPAGPDDFQYYVVWNGSTWIDVPPGWTIDGSSPLTYTCAADGCVFFDTNFLQRQVTWDGTTFSEVPFDDPFGEVTGLDCVSIDDCLANNDSATAHWDGSDWTVLPGNSPDDLGVYGTGTLTCGSADRCFTTGIDGSSSPVLVHWDGTTWTLQPLPVTARSSISCVEVDRCIAVTAGRFPQAFAWSGQYWLETPTMAGSLGVRYHAVSCVSLRCIAVGYEPAPIREPVAARYDYTNS